ncbi:hypothetical protein N4P33_03180 [Streptomyces sp. 15-116A]|uniref:hypothetical protein n=1 Tax=Streptomyces sp. 15-116A TaxID=2259035 RepID=UPI0021B35B8B|nr:hypothetical protein [Streptomyces sp. 15-116A]MCT7351173.1 hypothetical protein [Streptomyces sp. 15-116A]
MSWDVLLLRLPDDVASMGDLPGDFTPAPLGPAQDVLAALRRAVPEVDLTDPAWGELTGPGWSMELNIGTDDPVVTLMLHIRGGGDDVLVPVFRFAEALDCRVLDLAKGDLATPEDTTGWHAFQAYRDHVIGRG